jgi:hypothetical protein
LDTPLGVARDAQVRTQMFAPAKPTHSEPGSMLWHAASLPQVLVQ